MAKLTPFGKAVRHYRLERGETQTDIASALGVSTSFWSGIETGKRNIPDEMLEDLVGHFDLSPSEVGELERLAAASRSEVRINMNALSNPGREIALGFARKFESGTLTDQQLARLRELLDMDGV